MDQARDARRRLASRRRQAPHREGLAPLVVCPCCGSGFARFAPYGGEADVECPRCGSHERHRLLCFYFANEGRELLAEPRSVLHFAPEACLEPLLRAAHGNSYLTADLRRASAMAHFDIEEIPHPDGSFDVILCSHVLEHVADDRRALRELYRVLRPGGRALLLVPLADRAETYEDPRVVSPEGREREFGQFDHVRRYGADFAGRVEEAGFRIAVDRYVLGLDEAVVARHGMSSFGFWVAAKDGP